jgi:hypothetical protein
MGTPTTTTRPGIANHIPCRPGRATERMTIAVHSSFCRASPAQRSSEQAGDFGAARQCVRVGIATRKAACRGWGALLTRNTTVAVCVWTGAMDANLSSITVKTDASVCCFQGQVSDTLADVIASKNDVLLLARVTEDVGVHANIFPIECAAHNV